MRVAFGHKQYLACIAAYHKVEATLQISVPYSTFCFWPGHLIPPPPLVDHFACSSALAPHQEGRLLFGSTGLNWPFWQWQAQRHYPGMPECLPVYGHKLYTTPLAPCWARRSYY